MKVKTFYLLGAILLTIGYSTQAQTTNRGLTIGKRVPPHQSAILDIQSTEKGILLPRMTQDQRDAIPVNSGSHGLMIYQTDNASGLYVYFIDNATQQGTWMGLILSTTLRGIEGILAENNNANKRSLENLRKLLADTIGIGTTTPTEKLDVAGKIRMQTATESSDGDDIVTTKGYVDGMVDNVPVKFIDGTKESDAVYTTGNVGIGTASPTEKLDVAGKIRMQTATESADGDDIVTTKGYVDGMVDDVPVKFIDGTKESDAVYTTGNVGIGTASPTQKLHVVGKGYFSDSLGIGATTPTEKLDVAGKIRMQTATESSDGDDIVTTKGYVDGIVDDVPVKFIDGTKESDAVYTTGNVGIGTASPTQKLHVVGKSYFSDSLGIGATTPTEKLDVAGKIRMQTATESSDGDDIVTTKGYVDGMVDDVPVKFIDGTKESDAVYTTGNVGIGTASPTQKLHVVGKGYFSDSLGIGTTAPTERLDVTGKIRMQTATESSDGDDIVTTKGYVDGMVDDVPVKFIDGTKESDAVYTTGNVGIGTASPTQKLHVVGKSYFSDSLGIGTTTPTEKLDVAGKIRMQTATESSDGDDIVTTKGYVDGMVDDVPVKFIDGTKESDAVYTTGNVGIGTASPTQKLHVVGKGYFSDSLGIGTTAPTEKLDVAGKIRMQTATESSDGDDIVTTKGYVDGMVDDVPVKFIDGTKESDAVYTTGNVGIGTASPTQKLHVVGKGYFSDSLGIGTTAPTERLDVTGKIRMQTATESSDGDDIVTTKGYVDGMVDDVPVKFIDGTKESDAVYTTGNVGIGTASPTQKLHVVGKSYFSDSLGIGTTTPTEKLDVAGKIRMQTATESADGDDIVTTKGYVDGMVDDVPVKFIDGTKESDAVYTTGNVGIGTASPTQKLHVVGKGYFSDSLGIGTTAPTERLDVTGKIRMQTATESSDGDDIVTTKGYVDGIVDDVPVKFIDGTKESDAVYTTGNVGIGTASPTQKLHVVGKSYFSDSLGIGTTAPTEKLDVAGKIRMQTATESSDGDDIVTTKGYVDGMVDDVPVKFIDGTKESDAVYTTGNVGIGTASPTQKLHVVGKSYFSDSLTVNGNMIGNNIFVRNLNPNPTGVGAVFGLDDNNGNNADFIGRLRLTAGIQDSQDDSQGASIDLHGNDHPFNVGQLHLVAGRGSGMDPQRGNIQFWTNDGVSQDTRMVIDRTGRIGMGTTSPEQRLHVEGKGYFSDSLGIGTTTPTERLDVAGKIRMQTETEGTDGNDIVATKGYVDRMATGGVSIKFVDGNMANDAVYTAGNVGIGTADPTQRLHVEGKSYFSDSLTVNGNMIGNNIFVRNLNPNPTSVGAVFGLDDNNGNNADFIGRLRLTAGIQDNQDDSQGASIDLHGNDHPFNVGQLHLVAGRGSGMDPQRGNIQFWTNDGVSQDTRMVIDRTGRIGMGTTSPEQRLHVEGNGYFSDSLGIGTTSPSVKLDVSVIDNTNDFVKTIKLATNGADPNFQLFSTSGVAGAGTNAIVARIGVNYTLTDVYNGVINFHRGNGAANGFLSFGTGGTERVRITSGGNVGIGTTAPNTTLQVDGATTFRNAKGQYSSHFPFTDDNVYISGENIILRTTTNGTERMRITSGGRVGIGRSNPDYTLDVSSAETQTRLRLTNGSDEQTIFLRGGDNNFGIYDDRRNQTWLRYVSEADVDDRTLSLMERGGNVGIGTNAPTATLQVNGTTTFRNANDEYHSWFPFTDNRAYITGEEIVFRTTTNNTERMRIASNGNITTTARLTVGDLPSFGNSQWMVRSGGTLGVQGSDRRLKENIETIENPIEKVLSLRGVNFNWKDGGSYDMGLIAQEVEKAIPEVTFQNPADGYKGVNYPNMVGLLIEAIKEQQRQIEELQRKIIEIQEK